MLLKKGIETPRIDNERAVNSEISFFGEEVEGALEDDILSQFFEARDKTLKVFNKFPPLKNLFIKYNTPIPSSAPVEQVFSIANAVLTAKRSCLSEDNFEKQLLLKINKKIDYIDL